MLKSAGSFLDRHVGAIRTVEFSLALSCILAAWSAGGDAALVIPALILGFIFAVIGIATGSAPSRVYKFVLSGLVALTYIGIGVFLHWHFKEPKPTAPKTALPIISVEPSSVYRNNDPFSQQFTVINEGPMPIYDVHYTCGVTFLKLGGAAAKLNLPQKKRHLGDDPKFFEY